ncbi:MAG: patatin-like phospholipase family protein [Candidatus Dormibacteria bacterium]
MRLWPPFWSGGAPRGGTVFVLGGGGGRGAAQVGVLRALLDHGIRPDLVVGSSVGALNGAMLAARPDGEGMRLLEEIWHSPETAANFKPRVLEMALMRLRRRAYLHQHRHLEALAAHAFRLAQVASFEEMRIPLRVIATDIATGQKRVFASGPLMQPLLASCAIPGYYPPVEIEGRLYTDGGVAENLPLSTAVESNPLPSRIVAIDLMGGAPHELHARWAEVMERTLEVILHHRVLADFEAFRSRIDITILCPRPRAAGWHHDARLFGPVIEGARQATLELLDQQRRLRTGIHYLSFDAARSSGRRHWPRTQPVAEAGH